MTPISSIRLGDFFGGNVDILADSDTLCQLACVANVAALQALVEKSGLATSTSHSATCASAPTGSGNLCRDGKAILRNLEWSWRAVFRPHT